jgi:small-conductance mechanosensitive channel
MQRKRRKLAPPCPPGLPDWAAKEWQDLEFADDIAAITCEQAKADRKARKRFEELRRIIAADFEAERKKLLDEALRKRAEYLIDLKLTEMQEAIEADRADARRVLGAYVERVSAAFRKAVEREGKEREKGRAALKRVEADMQKSRLHDERMELIRRGVLKGRRR